jgi:predicted NUDIX family phosphoesterase
MKQALCIPKGFVAPSQGVFKFKFDGRQRHRLAMVPRDQCETDESLLQLIPYVVVRNKAGEFLCYERGVGGDESRLHAKLSIGLGGHVDRLPTEVEHLFDLARVEAARELHEEAGIADGARDIEYTGDAIYDDSDQVGRVHLGLLCEYVTDADPMVREADAVMNFHWASLHELLHENSIGRLENWSRLVLQHYATEFSYRVGESFCAFAEMVDTLTIASATGATGAAAQEVANVLRALGANLVQGHASASLFDRDAFGAAGYVMSESRREAAFLSGGLQAIEDE